MWGVVSVRTTSVQCDGPLPSNGISLQSHESDMASLSPFSINCMESDLLLSLQCIFHESKTAWFQTQLKNNEKETTNPFPLYMNIDIDNIWGFYGSPQPLDHRPMGFPTLPSKVFHIRWHMGHYGHDSQKPERGWTNNSYFQRLDLGTWKRGDGPKPKAITVKKTISKRTGKPCYTGTPALKATQPRPHLV